MLSRAFWSVLTVAAVAATISAVAFEFEVGEAYACPNSYRLSLWNSPDDGSSRSGQEKVRRWSGRKRATETPRCNSKRGYSLSSRS